MVQQCSSALRTRRSSGSSRGMSRRRKHGNHGRKSSSGENPQLSHQSAIRTLQSLPIGPWGWGPKRERKALLPWYLVSGIFNFKRNFIKAHTKTPKALHGRRPFIPFPRPPRPSSSPVRRRRHAPWPSPSPSHVAYWARARARALTLREERGLEHLALSLLSSLSFIFVTARLR